MARHEYRERGKLAVLRYPGAARYSVEGKLVVDLVRCSVEQVCGIGGHDAAFCPQANSLAACDVHHFASQLFHEMGAAGFPGLDIGDVSVVLIPAVVAEVNATR